VNRFRYTDGVTSYTQPGTTVLQAWLGEHSNVYNGLGRIMGQYYAYGILKRNRRQREETRSDIRGYDGTTFGFDRWGALALIDDDRYTTSTFKIIGLVLNGKEGTARIIKEEIP